MLPLEVTTEKKPQVKDSTNRFQRRYPDIIFECIRFPSTHMRNLGVGMPLFCSIGSCTNPEAVSFIPGGIHATYSNNRAKDFSEVASQNRRPILINKKGAIFWTPYSDVIQEWLNRTRISSLCRMREGILIGIIFIICERNYQGNHFALATKLSGNMCQIQQVTMDTLGLCYSNFTNTEKAKKCHGTHSLKHVRLILRSTNTGWTLHNAD